MVVSNANLREATLDFGMNFFVVLTDHRGDLKPSNKRLRQVFLGVIMMSG
jgi:hypothetical protein